jgi:hypothetical protein
VAALRKIVADITGQGHGQGGGPNRRAAWRQAVEFGSRVAAEHGIYVAPRLLRHADITTTAQYYLDKKNRVTSGLGRFLKDNPF